MSNAPIGVPGSQLQYNLNHCMPAAKDASLGDVIYGLINANNAMAALLQANPPTGTTAAEFAAMQVALPENR